MFCIAKMGRAEACLGSSEGYFIGPQCALAVWPSGREGPRFKSRAMRLGSCE